jgi:hypothetical protein
MAPLRHRDIRVASPSNPATARRVARGLTIDISVANNSKHEPDSTHMHELELALAAKEVELADLLTSGDHTPLISSTQRVPQATLLCQPPFPEIIDSFQSFNAMRNIFLRYLAQNNLLHIIPESKLYRTVYFPYG